jgi:hypothetical protein
VFPAQKVSFEAQRERKAGPGQTLTSLGSYWKGRKPLILIRAIVLGSLLPQTEDAEKDLRIFEKLMAFDDAGLARRALPLRAIKSKDIAERIILSNPWDYFSHNIKESDERFENVRNEAFPLSPDELKLKIQWRRDVEEEDKIELLNSLNIDWHAHGKQWSKWQRHFSKLKRYAEKTNGDPNVSQLMKGIGPWLSSQRVLYRQGLLSNSKRVLMESIGVCWNPSQRVDDRWWRQFEKLKSFKDKHGHCNVPRRELPDPGIWVSAQRTSFKKGTLKKERIDALNGIGFSWQIRKSGD